MRTLYVITLFVISVLIPSNIISQELNSERRTQEIIASFNKQKNANKEKYGVSKEKYKRVQSESVTRPDIRDYAGVYEVPHLGYAINIEVGSDGKVEETGYEPASGAAQPARGFRLADTTIVGALLTATKIYEDGTTEKFEGVFINRTEFNSPTDSGISAFGLGVVGKPVEFAGLTFDKLFYQLKK